MTSGVRPVAVGEPAPGPPGGSAATVIGPGHGVGRVLRLLGVSWWLSLKMASRSAFDGALAVIYPMFFATTILLVFRAGHNPARILLAAAVGSAVMAIWSATSTRAAYILQMERRQGTLELLVASPAPFPLVMLPLTLSMATVGVYAVAVTLLWGRLVFGIHLAVRDPALMAFGVVLTALAVGSLGFLLAVSSVRYRSAWALGTALELPIWLICGFLVPLSLLPAWVRPISWLLAPTWGMDAVRAGTAGATAGAVADIAACVALIIAYGLLATLVAARLVTSARRHASLTLS